MTRPLRFLLLSVATVLVVALAITIGWARLGDSPTAASADDPAAEDAPSEDASAEVPSSEDLSTDELAAVTSLDPIDPSALGISLEVDRTRAPLAQVVEQFRTRVEAAPDDYISLSLLGSVLLAQAREDANLDLYSEAEVIAEQVLELAPTDTDGQLLHINALAARHEFAATLEASAEILESEPNNVGALSAQGDAQLALGDTAEAEATFTTIASLDRNAGIVSRLSRTAYLEGDTARAVDLAVESLELAQGIPLRPSEAAFYWFQLGFVLYEGGDIDGAAASLEIAVDIAPEHPGANELLARVRTSQGRLDDAMAIYRGLLERGPAADLHGKLSQLLRLTGDDTGADEQLELGLALAEATMEKYPAERRHLASFLTNHDPEAAVGLAETDLATRADAGAYETLGWALHAAGQSAQADPLLRQAVSNGPRSAELLARAGIVAAAVGDDDRSVVLLDAALRLNPTFDPLTAPIAAETLAELGG